MVRVRKSSKPFVPVSTFRAWAIPKTSSAVTLASAVKPDLNAMMEFSAPASPDSANPGWASLRSSMEYVSNLGKPLSRRYLSTYLYTSGMPTALPSSSLVRLPRGFISGSVTGGAASSFSAGAGKASMGFSSMPNCWRVLAMSS